MPLVSSLVNSWISCSGAADIGYGVVHADLDPRPTSHCQPLLAANKAINQDQLGLSSMLNGSLHSIKATSLRRASSIQRLMSFPSSYSSTCFSIPTCTDDQIIYKHICIYFLLNTQQNGGVVTHRCAAMMCSATTVQKFTDYPSYN